MKSYFISWETFIIQYWKKLPGSLIFLSGILCWGGLLSAQTSYVFTNSISSGALEINDAETDCSAGVYYASSQQNQSLTSSQLSTISSQPATKKLAMEQGRTYNGSMILTSELNLLFSQISMHKVRVSFDGVVTDYMIPWADFFGSIIGTIDFSVVANNPSIDPGTGNSTLLTITILSGDDQVVQQIGANAIITGSTIHTEPEWTTTFPEVPQLILRDPPGDGSYSFLQSAEETCHGYGLSIATDQSAGVYAEAKLGVSGSVGFIATTNFEAYASISGSMDMGVRINSQNETQVCFQTSSEFSTDSSNPSLTGSDGDVFIGASIVYAYGVGRTLTNDCGNVYVYEGMVFSPVSTNSSFAYTEEHIINVLMPNLEQIIASNSPGSSAHQTATDQLEIWQQLINNNNEIKNEASFATSRSFSGGTSQTYEEAVSTSQSKQFEMNVYIETEAAIEAGVEVGGSGVSGGVRIRAQNETGSSSSSSNSSTNTVGYNLADDDTGDQFVVNVLEDRVYGTPVFELSSGSTSCPYEGGYQIDQPMLRFTDGTSSANLPFVGIGQDGSFNLDICNNSDQERTYHLKIINETNGAGLIIEGFGENLSSDALGADLTVPAQGCLENAIITFRQTNTTIQSYEGVQLRLYSLCQEDADPIESIVTFNATFADLPDNDLPCNAVSLPTDGGVQSGFTNEFATVDTDEQSIAPMVGDCSTSWCSQDQEIQNSVWFSFVAPASGGVQISTCDLADFDTQIAVYEVADCGAYSTYLLLGANDDGPEECATDYDSWMEIEGLTTGQAYYVMVDGYAGATGTFGISVTALVPPAPANDLACNAIDLPVDGSVQSGFTNEFATVDTDEQSIVPMDGDCSTAWCTDDQIAQNSVWFSFVAPGSGSVEVSTCGLADFDTQIALYAQEDCGNYNTYTLLGANDDGPEECATDYDSYLTIADLVPGQTYYVLVDGYQGGIGIFDIFVNALIVNSVRETIAHGPEMKVVPNPNQGQFSIQYNGLEDDALLQIVNAVGTVVYEQFVERYPHSALNIDLQNFPGGIYMARLGNEKQLSVQKIVIDGAGR